MYNGISLTELQDKEANASLPLLDFRPVSSGLSL